MRAKRIVGTLEERFWPKVAIDTRAECWEWLASKKPHGYGQFSLGLGRIEYAHRVAYTLLIGPIPAGAELDHLCRNTSCVNPYHLEPVTHRENCGRTRKAHCIRGHALSGDNVYLWRGTRSCLACRRERSRKFHAAA